MENVLANAAAAAQYRDNLHTSSLVKDLIRIPIR
jgi:hypothetical protein